MALTIPCETSATITLEEFVAQVEAQPLLREVDSIVSCAPLLKALSNDRSLVARKLNECVKSLFASQTIPSAQSIYLGGGRGFFVRANIWPSAADVSHGLIYQDYFSYSVAHDHNYDFMTVGYSGPGYVTEIYEYEYARVKGFVGEPVALEFQERVVLSTGSVMVYRASKDVHIQFPPDDLSITLNLMLDDPHALARDQYCFDLTNHTLTDLRALAENSRRASVVRLAGYTGDADTEQLLRDLSTTHFCRRTRIAAFEALACLRPPEAVEIWEAACRDPDPLVVHFGKKVVDGLIA